MRVTESTFPFPDEPTDEALRRDLERALGRRWALSIAHASAPASPEEEWEEWGGPVLDAEDVEAALDELRACRAAFPGRCVKLVAVAPARAGSATRVELVVQRGAPPARRAARPVPRARRDPQPERSAP